MDISTAMIVGQTQAHLAPCDEGSTMLHIAALEPLRALQKGAAQAGFELRVASGFRSFERQLAIWNSKATGVRPVLDKHCQPLDLSRLDDRDKIFAILRWSALPGTSRHHWGTDMDIWDAAAVAEDYSLQLVPEEYAEGGPFYGLNSWLDQQLENAGFFRPYAEDTGGVAPEAWHLSCRSVAEQFERQLDISIVREVLIAADLALKETVLDCLDEIFERFIYQTDK